jgi:hypothetical protein
MYAILNLNWVPSASSTEPAAGQASALVRGDTYAHSFTFYEDVDAATPVPFEIEGDIAAQLRTAKLPDETADTALASFVVTVDVNVITISLTPEETLDLPSAGYWDLQQDLSGVVTTLLQGKFKVVDDVTRVEA